MPRKKRCKVFVSYSRHDEALVKPLAQLLGVASDQAVFLDIDSINPGELWESRIEEAIRDAPVFILCWCCQCGPSHFIQREVALALEDSRKQLVPVRLCSSPLPQQIAQRQWINLSGQIVHSCNHPIFDVRHGQPGSVTGAYPSARSLPPRPSSPPKRAAGLLPILGSLAAIFVLSIALLKFTTQKSGHISQSSNAPDRQCLFENGPRAGLLGSEFTVSPSDPGKCVDEAGYVGSIIKKNTPIELPAEEERSFAWPIIAAAAVLLALLIAGFLRHRAARSVQTEAKSIADRATSYFSGLAQ